MIKIIFYSLIMVFAFIVASILMPDFIRKYMSRYAFFASWIAFFSLGATLIFFTLKEQKQNLLKKFLMLTGASAIGFPIGVVLHNMFYALNVVFEHIAILNYLTQALGILFFLIAIIVCPICFLIGVIGSIKLFLKKRTIANSKFLSKKTISL